MTRNASRGPWCALLLVASLAACSRGGEDAAWDRGPFPGEHIFEGRVSEALDDSEGNYVLIVGDETYALQGNKRTSAPMSGVPRSLFVSLSVADFNSSARQIAAV